MLDFRELQKIVDSSLQGIQIENKPSELYDPIKYTLDAGGKRMRPILVLAACNLFSEEVSFAIEPALAIEVFHNFTLLHDDLMDNADMRRNRPTVHKKWNPNIAILSGDAMMIKAYQLILKAPSVNLAEIIEVFNKTALEICEGQQYDMNFEERLDVTEEEYLEMIRLKTSVLVAASLKIGALCADASKEDANKLYEFGVNLGLAFQLQDDYLDSFGDEKKFGKKIGGDIVANKKTFLLIKALELANETQAKRLNELITDPMINSLVKIKEVVDLYEKLGIKELVKDKMDAYFDKAMDAFNQIGVDATKKSVIRKLAEDLMVRES